MSYGPDVATLALTALSSSEKPVYNATTVPIADSENIVLNNARPPNGSTGDDASESAEESRKPALFSNLPGRKPVDIQFKDVKCTVGLGFNKGKIEILHEINGKFPGSQLIAIMGPSGAGKSTLLDVLSGYRKTGVTGAVYVNGRIRNLDTFRKMTCYITQDDRLQPLLTVLENMRIAADFKLGDSYTYHQKEARIEDILTVLGLYEHQMTLAKMLSGGQKKRLSIALELINNPTVMFLDEPTSGLDTFSCNQVVDLLKALARQGRTIITTIHQPSAKLFEVFDQVYVLSAGECLYQGSTQNLVPYLQSTNLPCPIQYNPADYIIELACGEYGTESIQRLVHSMDNGDSTKWFANPAIVMKLDELRKKYPLQPEQQIAQENGQMAQLKVLLTRGMIKMKRDQTLTHLRVGVNIALALMLGFLFINAGNEGSRVLDNYNLLFAILMHHSMTTMMLTVLTFPTEMAVVLKEHFNRWYSLKAYYMSVTILEIPISVVCCFIFTAIIYPMSGQPLEWFRFGMFFVISQLVVFVGQSLGLMVGAWFDVINGTFLAPTMTVPLMMFAGFGVTLRDLPSYLKWGSHISHLRYGLEGYVNAIYGNNRETLVCEAQPYCHYKYPQKFLSEISMEGDQFWNDLIALVITTILVRMAAYALLRLKVLAVR